MGEAERRRRRSRPPAAPPDDSGGQPVAESSAAADPGDDHGSRAPSAVPRPASQPAHRSPAGARPTSGAGSGLDDRDGERNLRGLVGSGSSQVSTSAALRARDAARPTGAHLAEAERRLVIVRRNWAPREELPRGG